METIKYLATENGQYSPIMALAQAFKYGYEMGVRATKAERKKRKCKP